MDIAVVESNPFTFYVASATGGVWKTTNNGVTFEPVFKNEGTHSVGAIAVHQLDTNIVWVGTGERARDVATEIDEILPLLTEVRRRLTQLYNRIDGWAGPPTADQRRQLAYLAEWVVRLQPRVERVVGAAFTPSPPEPDIGLWQGSPASGRRAVPPRAG